MSACNSLRAAMAARSLVFTATGASTHGALIKSNICLALVSFQRASRT